MESKGNNALQPGVVYTIEDYKSWPEGERWELINGEAFAMSPAPKLDHQRLILSIVSQLRQFFNGKPCEPFVSPVDVFLNETTVVQPDVMVVCDQDKCQEGGIHGAPDLVIEILSPSTIWRDQTEKRNLYEQSGVREYWIVNPETFDTMIYVLNGKEFKPPKAASLVHPIESEIFPGLLLSR